MDEKHNTLLERGADNDIVRLRWRLQIRENIIGRLVAENQRLRLTAEELEAVTYFSDYGETPGEARRASTLRSLLERMK
jgi:hypothetical protein